MTRQRPGCGWSFARPSARAITNVILILLVGFLFVSCSEGNPTISPTYTLPLATIPFPTQSTALPILSTITSQPKPSLPPTQPTLQIWLAPNLPEKMRASIVIPDGYIQVDTPDGADIVLGIAGADMPATNIWIYALVVPFPTVTDGITSNELLDAWQGNSIPPFTNSPLLMTQNTLDVLSVRWGTPSAGAVQVLPADQMIGAAWSNRPSWAIVPFEALDPQWKVLTIDDQSPVRKDFDSANYKLTIPFALVGKGNPKPEMFSLPFTNRDPAKLTTVALTGVTAMVRATAFTMEQDGITYPAQDIGPILTQADITHISNEIPFSPDCPYPTPTMDALVFCSSPKYIDLLKAVGTDIVELTGDHFMDYGADATLFTLQMYKDLGWPYYGGGANADEARQPVKLENNGNKIAFMGCNVGCQVKNEIPCDAIATDSHPGAAQCDFNWIANEIPALRDEGYQVIFTFQHREYYTYTTEPILADDFGLVAAAGATIISGSQAHQPHGFSFENGSFIHYGLGNLFFDQYHYCVDNACDDAFIDRHVFYDGRYISTELITIRFVDFARPRLMTPDERMKFLDIIFNASGW